MLVSVVPVCVLLEEITNANNKIILSTQSIGDKLMTARTGKFSCNKLFSRYEIESNEC